MATLDCMMIDVCAPLLQFAYYFQYAFYISSTHSSPFSSSAFSSSEVATLILLFPLISVSCASFTKYFLPHVLADVISPLPLRPTLGMLPSTCRSSILRKILTSLTIQILLASSSLAMPVYHGWSYY